MTEFEPHRPLSLEKPTTPYQPVGHDLQHQPQWNPGGPGYGPVAGYGYPQPTPYPVATTTVVGQQSNVEIILAWIFTVLTALYMLPWAIAATRRSTNSILIAIATFFLAWTGIGWLVLLVLSFLGPTVYTARATTIVVAPQQMPPGMWAHCATDPPNVQRWWDGHAWTGHTIVN